MRSKVLFFFLLFTSFILRSKAQTYPHGYFRNPIDTPFVLAGTFGEIRPDHFHTGLDFSTKEREGVTVYAAAAGYVSRIKVSADGFGKVIYITHPNGFVSVYAHLKKYAGAIEKYIRKNQYKLESFQVELFPTAHEITVKKGEVIAYSGNTGSSGGPHLHFEIRDEKTEEPLNPMLFGYVVPDQLKPGIKSLRIVPVPLQGIVMTTDTARTFPVSNPNNGTNPRVPDVIKVFGKVGFEFNVSDLQMKGGSELGVYSVQFKIDDKTVFGYKYDRLNFNDTRYANAHIDYAAAYDGDGIYQRCFKFLGDKLKIYNDPAQDGYYDFQDDGSHDAELIVRDYNGNLTTLKFIVESSATLMKFPFQTSSDNEYALPADKNFSVHTRDLEVDIPAEAIYESTFFSIKESIGDGELYSSKFQVGDPHVPLHLAMTIGIKPMSLPPTLKPKAVVISYDKKGKIRYEGGSWLANNDFLSIKTRHFGTFAISADTTNPVISIISMPSNKKDDLRIKITDDLSGIKSYRAMIDGKWNLMEYDRKTNTLIGDLSVLSKGKTHHLELTVTDAVGNKSVLKKDFSY